MIPSPFALNQRAGTLQIISDKITAKENVAETDAASGTEYDLQLTEDETSTGQIDYTN